MSLVGSLEDLGLGDILQIVSLSRKSGLLLLRSEEGEGRIAFFEGLVRDHNEGRAVSALEYEIYESMARTEAARIAQEHLGQERAVTAVTTYAELEKQGRRQPAVYMRSAWTQNDVWIAYAGPIMPNAICASFIVMVSRSTGEVVHAGSAGDEG